MPRIKKATDASGNVFYPATISKAVWDIDNNQRLSVTIAGKQDLIDSSNKLSADLITDGTTNKVINVKPDWNAASGDAAEILNKPTIPSYNTFGASGTNHSSGLVPDPGATQGTTKYLREDGTWAVPEDSTDLTDYVQKSEIYDEISGGYVDLGLSSGLLWATGNIVKDANGNYSMGKPTDYGCYFSWGNIIGHNNGEGYDFGTSNRGPYASTPGAQVSANIASNDASHDAALACLGAPWHMPTKEDFKELYDNTDREWTSIDGINGWKFMKKTDHSVYVFFPAAGYGYGTSVNSVGTYGFYWSSSWHSASNACNVDFDSSSVSPQYINFRYSGFSVRAVANTPPSTPKYAQKSELADVATSGSYNDLTNKPTNVSAFTNDAKYVTEDDMQVDVIDANGHDYVDLGLPSGTLWATMNVGASSETNYGNYYQYGKGAAQYEATSGSSTYSGTEDPLDSSVDTATQVWGGSWHMPTQAQLNELKDNTTYEWTTIGGMRGGKFTAQNGNYVFFPAAGRWHDGKRGDVNNGGYYWGSSPDGSDYAFYFYFDDGFADVSDYHREFGCQVHPVLNASKSPKYATKAELADVATSGSYNDLVNKPTIPVVPTNVSDFNNDAGYLTQHQDISGKADKSEMSVTDGTGADNDKTTIQLKSGTSATVLKSHQSLAGKQDVIDAQHKLSADLVDDSTSTNKFTNATEKQTWNNKQDALVSGTNIKTINNESILGNGNITIQGGVQSDWNQSDSTADDFIKNKPTIPTVPDLSKGTTTGSGNAVTDISVSGHTITLTKDITFLTSHQDISGKEDKMTVVTQSSGTTLTAAVGNYYRFTYNVGTLAITLPTPTGSNAQSVLFFMTTGASPAVTFTSTGNTIYKNDGFAIDASTTYEINALWNGGAWVINTVKYTT